MWRLNNMLLNNHWVKEIKRAVKKYFETNENGKATYQNLWDTAQAVVSGKFIGINTYIKMQERSQIKKIYCIPQRTRKKI